MDILQKLYAIVASELVIPVEVPCERSEGIRHDPTPFGAADPQTGGRVGRDILVEAIEEIERLRLGLTEHLEANAHNRGASADEIERLRQISEAQEGELVKLKAERAELVKRGAIPADVPPPTTTGERIKAAAEAKNAEFRAEGAASSSDGQPDETA